MITLRLLTLDDESRLLLFFRLFILQGFLQELQKPQECLLGHPLRKENPYVLKTESNYLTLVGSRSLTMFLMYKELVTSKLLLKMISPSGD